MDERPKISRLESLKIAVEQRVLEFRQNVISALQPEKRKAKIDSLYDDEVDQEPREVDYEKIQAFMEDHINLIQKEFDHSTEGMDVDTYLRVRGYAVEIVDFLHANTNYDLRNSDDERFYIEWINFIFKLKFRGDGREGLNKSQVAEMVEIFSSASQLLTLYQ
jgi:hypothetical protein